MRKRQKKKLTWGKRSDRRCCPSKWRHLRDAGYARKYMTVVSMERLYGALEAVRVASDYTIVRLKPGVSIRWR